MSAMVAMRSSRVPSRQSKQSAYWATEPAILVPTAWASSVGVASGAAALSSRSPHPARTAAATRAAASDLLVTREQRVDAADDVLALGRLLEVARGGLERASLAHRGGA